MKHLDAVSLSGVIQTYAVNNFPQPEVQKINTAIQIASYLHRNAYRRGQRGTTENPPYVEHPLRVAIRIFRSLKANPSSDTIIAAILHDTVEDNPQEFVAFKHLTDNEINNINKNANPSEVREAIYSYLGRMFSHPVVRIVESVTNPVEGDYNEHVEQALRNDSPTQEGTFLVKISDFFDNAGSLHHHYKVGGQNKPTKLIKKYEPLVALFNEVMPTTLTPAEQAECHKRLHNISEYFTAMK